MCCTPDHKLKIKYNTSLAYNIYTLLCAVNFRTMSYETENKIIEAPVVTIDDFYNEEKTLIIHNYINMKGKMVLNKEEASLLLIELYKFVKS